MAVLAVVPALVAVALGSWWLRYEVHASLYASMSRTLEEKSQRISTRLYVSPDGRVQEAAGSGDEFSAIFSGWYWQLADSAHGAPMARSRSLWDQGDLKPQARPVLGARHLRRAQGPQRDALLVQAFPVQLAAGGPTLQLQVFGPAQPLLASVRRIDHILWATGAMLLLLLGGLVWFQLRVGLAPLKRLVDVIAGLRKPIDLARQPAPSATAQIQQLPLGPDLAPLQHELAALLARNALVVERARSHAADLNHALKKPLSLLMAHAGSEAAVPSHTVLGQTTAMARLIDRYQARIHSDAKPEAADQAVEVLACTAQMLAMMRQLHQAQGLDWQWLASSATPALWWRGARADLEELLGNVLDNAGKWAASRVQVRVQRGGEGLLQVLVDDDGPGMTEAQMHAAGERGRRFDESVAGTGLGLSIAQQIVQSYDGSLQLRQSDALKGLQVRMVLGGLLD